MKKVSFFKEYLETFKKFSKIIQKIVNTIVRSLSYFIGAGLSVLIMRITKKKLMGAGINKNKETYWEEIQQKKQSLNESLKQF